MQLTRNYSITKVGCMIIITILLFFIYIFDIIYNIYCKNDHIKCNYTIEEKLEFHLIIYLTFIILCSISIYFIINIDSYIDKCYLCIKKKCDKCNKRKDILDDHNHLNKSYISTTTYYNHNNNQENIIGKM